MTKRFDPNAILLLASEPVVRTVMKEALENAGYVVLATGSLGTAVDMLGDSKVGLLIIPPYIDNLTGHEAAKYLRARNPLMGILMVGGYIDDDRIRYRAKIEGFEIFPAPYPAAELLSKVAEVIKAAQARAAHSAGDGHRPAGQA